MELSAHAPGAFSPTQLFLVGGEDYVAREWKRRFTAMGIGVAGHAPKTWRPPFAPPKFTTHLFVIEDDCGPALREAAHRLSTEHRIPLIEAPARNRPTETIDLLRKEGLVEPEGNATPEAKPVVQATAAPSPAPAPPPASSTPTNTGDIMAADPATPRTFAARLLKESSGLATDKIVAAIVRSKTGQSLPPEDVAKVRKEGKFPKAQTGKRPRSLVALLAKYGYTDGSKPSTADLAKTNGVPVSANGQDEEQFHRALLIAIRGIEEKVLAPFTVSRLVLVYENGQWRDPEVERLQPTRMTFKLPKRVPPQRR